MAHVDSFIIPVYEISSIFLQVPLRRPSGRMRKFTAAGIEIQLCPDSTSGFLSEYGIPIPQIPTRLGTGDIILFDTNRVISKVTSAFTSSRWDHVGKEKEILEFIYIYIYIYTC